MRSKVEASNREIPQAVGGVEKERKNVGEPLDWSTAGQGGGFQKLSQLLQVVK